MYAVFGVGLGNLGPKRLSASDWQADVHRRLIDAGVRGVCTAYGHTGNPIVDVGGRGFGWLASMLGQPDGIRSAVVHQDILEAVAKAMDESAGPPASG